jgi:hypothetical protein
VKAIKTKKEKNKKMTETNKEAKLEQAVKNISDAGLQKAVDTVASVGLEQRIERTVNEYVDKKLDARFSSLEKSLDEKIEGIVKAKEIEVESALRKGFGLENDPVIHQSDLIATIRKLELEKADTGKKTPTAVEKGGPEGTTQKTDPIDALLQKYEVKL